jgi:hypothetical protein
MTMPLFRSVTPDIFSILASAGRLELQIGGNRNVLVSNALDKSTKAENHSFGRLSWLNCITTHIDL